MLPFGGSSSNHNAPPSRSTRNRLGAAGEDVSHRSLREQASLTMGRHFSETLADAAIRTELDARWRQGHPTVSSRVPLPSVEWDPVSRVILLAAAQQQQQARDTALVSAYLEQALHRQRQADRLSSLQAHALRLRQALTASTSLALEQPLHQPLHQHQHIDRLPDIRHERLSAPRYREDAPFSSPVARSEGSIRLLSDAASVATLPPPPLSARPASPADPPPSPQGSQRTFPSERASLALDVRRARHAPAEAWKVLEALGKTLRGKADPYVDVSAVPDPGDLEPREKRRGASVFFPEVLYRLLDDVDTKGWQDIVSFLPHGRAFRVHNKHLFLDQLLPQYFVGQTKWSSFCRQLNIYGFLRVSSGPDYGAYYHELFLQGRPELVRFLRRVGAPHGLDRRTFKLSEGRDPDFYAMPPLPRTAAATNTAKEQEGHATSKTCASSRRRTKPAP